MEVEETTLAKSKAATASDLEMIRKDSSPHQSKLGTFHHALVHFSDSVSIVGFRYIFLRKANLVRRLLWLLLVLGGLGFVIYQVKGRVDYYMTSPVTVSISFNQKTEIKFPTVTVCSENRMRRSAIEATVPDIASTLEEVYMPWDDEAYVPDINITGLKLLNNQYSMEKLESTFADTAFFHHCLFDGSQCTYDRTISTSLGLCIQFNTHGNWSLTRAGLKYGLQLVLYANESDYGVINGMGRGMRMLIHDNAEFTDIDNLGVYVPSGFTQNFPITLQNITSIGEPYVNCTKQGGYVRSMCVARCKATYFVNRCKCCPHYLPCDGSEINRSCTLYDTVLCLKNATERWYADNFESACSCQRQCDYIGYPYSFHQTKMSDKFASLLSDILKVPMTTNEAKDGFAFINIYFSELKEEEIQTTSAYTGLALLCDIGGALGLILGSTLLTTFELVDFFVATTWESATVSKT